MVGTHDEDLLLYVRPIIWDASITYEFLYRENVDAVFPCLGRTAVQFSPAGVSLHQLTDGRFQRSPLRPDNSIPLAGSIKPNLIDGWNRVELHFRGSKVDVRLNGNSIVETEFAEAESRTFGLFHYRDQTRATVRNVHLTGDWPTRLPALNEQAFIPQVINLLETSATALPNQWTHDFRDGLPDDHFCVEGKVSAVTEQADGVHVVRTDVSDRAVIKFCGIIDGDFDITVGVQDLLIGNQKPDLALWFWDGVTVSKRTAQSCRHVSET